MPNASRPSCRKPATSRLAPEMVSPDARSRVAVVSRAPGRNVTSGAISELMVVFGVSLPITSSASVDTIIATTTGASCWSGALCRNASFSVPTRAPRPADSARSNGVAPRTRLSPTLSSA
ncbi:MAG TPA: hypothetical protein VIC57_17540 [Candidatus Dormibacteraeota bacterium]|jgi:hypothetical protein